MVEPIYDSSDESEQQTPRFSSRENQDFQQQNAYGAQNEMRDVLHGANNRQNPVQHNGPL